MKKENKGKNGHFKPCLLLIGSMIGAGFITGSEIWHFFARFKAGMLFGVVIFAVLIYYLTLNEFKNNNDFSQPKNSHGKLKNKLNFLCELLVASAMISGLKLILKQLFYNNYIYILIIIILVIFTILIIGFKSFSFYNYFVIVFLLFVIGCILLNNNNNFIINTEFNTNNCILSIVYSIIYVFMNFSTIKPIIRNYSKDMSLNNCKICSLAFSIILTIIILIFSIVLFGNLWVVMQPMPFLSLFLEKGNVFGVMFSIGVVITMISTALACLFGCEMTINKMVGDKWFSSIFVLLVSIIFSFLSFESFVKFVYPIIGFVNFVIFGFDFFKNLKFQK